jgi:colanic acid/amylovoran biosynthesis glycosyltransferase
MKKLIAHSLHTYLFRTGSWIYSQLTHVKKFESLVIATRKQNLDVFPWEDAHFLSELSPFSRFIQREYAKRTDFYYPYFYRLLKKRQPALLQSHFGNRGYFDLKLKEKLHVPQVTTFYGHDASMMPQDLKWRSRYNQLFNRCELFLAEGMHMKKTLVELGCEESKVCVQRLGVDLEKIPFIPRRLERDRSIRILIASTFRDKKGITYGLEAFAKLIKTHDNVELTLIGDAGRSQREVEYKKEIMWVIKNNNLNNKINYLGFLPYPEFIEESKKHDVFLAPSIKGSDGETEGGAPVTLVEMSAYGMPVVSTLHCDIPEVILDGRSGFLVPEKDVDSLTERLAFLITHPEKWEDIGRAGRKHIEQEYDAKKQAMKLEEIYARLM